MHCEWSGRVEGRQHRISLPGTGEAPNCPVFIDGVHTRTLRGTYEELASEFRTLIDDYVATRYARRTTAVG